MGTGREFGSRGSSHGTGVTAALTLHPQGDQISGSEKRRGDTSGRNRWVGH